MFVVDLGHCRQARAWFEDIDECVFSAAGTAEKTQQAGRTRSSAVRGRVAVELYVPAGAVTRTGLLGAVFSGDLLGEELTVRVAYSTKENDKPASWLLASKVDETWIGLPRQYVDAILAAVLACPWLDQLGAGVLSFDRAAHGTVGSSPAVFGELAQCVVYLLSRKSEPRTPEELQLWLRTAMEPRS
ncbi:MAG: hypothetical protein ACYC3X_24020 [Pirellulaceae bacterium]